MGVYRGAEYAVHYLPKVKLEIAVSDVHCERVMEVLSNEARTGNIGDGKIFVLPLESALRIRTGETGDNAV